MRILLFILALVLLPNAYAVTPEEQLADSALETRARGLSMQMRCLVCQNQSIDDSDADLAKDLRLEIRRQLTAGKTDQAIIDDIQQKYGDYVLLNPPLKGHTLLLWLSPILILLIGGTILFLQFRHGTLPKNTTINTSISDQDTPTDKSQDTQKPIKILPLMAILLGVILMSGGLYFLLGRPDLPAQPFAARKDAIAAIKTQAAAEQNAAQRQLQQAIAATEDDPQNISKWLVLHQRAIFAGNLATEQRAIVQARSLQPNSPELIAMHAETLIRMAEGQVTPPAKELLNTALALDPINPRARYMFGLAAYQEQQYSTALDIWQNLLDSSTKDAPWLATVQDAIRRTQQKIQQENQLTEQDNDTEQMITNMVQGLAEKLKDNPNDLDGWQRLARAYAVRGEIESHIDALFNIARLQPTDWQAQLTPLELMLSQKLIDDHLQQTRDLLDRLRAINPERLEYLFFAGHYAKLTDNTETARKLWQELYDRLPADSPIGAQLLEEIAELKD